MSGAFWLASVVAIPVGVVLFAVETLWRLAF